MVGFRFLQLLVTAGVYSLVGPLQINADIYSRQATQLWGAKEGTTVIAPDGSKKVEVLGPDPKDQDRYARIVVESHGRVYQTAIGSWVNAEMAWAPDSHAFFVTYSDGGNIGTYHVKIVEVAGSGLRILEPIANGEKFLKPHCFGEEQPNVGAIKWNSSSQLVIAVEVPPHSSCASMGTFRVVLIELPSGRVQARYDQLTAKKQFAGDIGSELRGADDDCVIKPQTCVPRGLK